VFFIVHKTTSELEHVILTTLYVAGTKNTDSWCARKGNLQRAFPLYVLMVHSSVLIVITDSECLTCSGFSLDETVHFGSLEFIVDCFGGLTGGMTQTVPSWAKSVVGHYPHYGRRLGTPPMSSTWLQVEWGALV
jgi:hypothetical protein